VPDWGVHRKFVATKLTDDPDISDTATLAQLGYDIG
jgi:hypothetical protein